MKEEIKTITVRTNPAYPVHIGAGLLAPCGSRLRGTVSPCRIAIVSDSTVAPLYLDTAARSLLDAGFAVSRHIFPAGEASKNLSTLSMLLERFAASRLTRSDCVAALGGGVTGDLAGFAAAVYLRGVRCIQLPTTLLAAVDSSVGGKTAVDLRAGKNLAGAFLQPTAVLCDTDCLKSLPPDILADGAAEAIKTGVLFDASLFARLERGAAFDDIAETIAGCVGHKAAVVERDETEQGERKLLNLGHTVGHAIEVCSGCTVPHGHAVAAGLAIIARASERLGWTSAPLAQRLTACLAANGLPVGTGFSAAQLAEAALADKKRSGNTITLVVPEAIGRCVLKTVPVTLLPAVIAAGSEV